MELTLEDKIVEISCKVERLGTVARVAANSSFTSETPQKALNDVLYCIQDLCKLIAGELDSLADEFADMTNTQKGENSNESI
ncbi:MAG: hypothetical protein NC299_13545 [Lachnospiraceae bacterium]|nr:hypothetical protein [Ruminococcus sp.]MCM1276360.1 hypothetical protein [Lachnospiraceae bacterium]